MAEEESNCRNIDSFVQEPHRKGVPEAVEGDMLADTCSRDELGDFMVEDVRRHGGEADWLIEFLEGKNITR